MKKLGSWKRAAFSMIAAGAKWKHSRVGDRELTVGDSLGLSRRGLKEAEAESSMALIGCFCCFVWTIRWLAFSKVGMKTRDLVLAGF